jgi:hypothetical protein
MASIKISELRPLGSELFQDQESFLHELNEKSEIEQVLGGSRRGYYLGLTISAQTVVGNSYNANSWGNLNTVAVG